MKVLVEGSPGVLAAGVIVLPPLHAGVCFESGLQVGGRFEGRRVGWATAFGAGEGGQRLAANGLS